MSYTKYTDKLDQSSGNNAHFRYACSITYHADTNTSTVTLTPQWYSDSFWSNDIIMYAAALSNPGVYIGGSKVWAFSTQLTSGNRFTATSGYGSWASMSVPGSSLPTATIQHDNSGYGTVKLGIIGRICDHYNVTTLKADFNSANAFTLSSDYQARELYVEYDSNGGSTTPAKTYFYGTTEDVVLAAAPAKTGYNFAGWYTAASGGTKVGDAGANIGRKTASFKVYAHWTAKTWTVSYNKGTGGTGTNTSDTKTYGVTLTLKGAIFTKTGYTQTAWTATDQGTTKAYDLGGSYTANAAATLYPLWTINKYTVTCQDRVGNSSGTLLGTKTASYNYGSSVSGASFGSDASYDKYYTGYHYTGSSTATTVTGATTVYRYFALNTWTVSYNKGSSGTGTNTSDTKTYNVALTLKGAIFTRTGYTQTGWSTTDGGAKTYNLSASYTSNAGTTLYPVWTVNSYTVTCKDYVGSTSGTLLGTKTGSYNYGASVSGASFGSSTAYDAYYAGYHYTSSSSAVTVPANNTTVVYRYFAINTWNVTYNANGGSSTPTTQTKTYGVTLTLAAAIARASTSPGSYTVTYNYNGSGKANTTATSTRTTNYTFSKWNTKQDGSGTNYNASASYTANAALALYAQWTSSETRAAVTLPSATWTGRTFNGWYDAASGGNKIGNAGASYTPSGNKTLYAHWTLNTYTYSATAGTDIASVSLNGTSSTTTTSATVNYGSSNTFVATLGSNAAYTYTFSGWYNGTTKVSSDLSYTVASATGALALTAKASKTAKSYKLSLTAPNIGGSATVRRTSSPNGGGATGVLSNNATIYYGDVLQVSYTENAGYEVDVHTINGATFASPTNVTVTGNVTVVVSMKNAGLVWIWTGSAWEKYIPMIWNGSAWVHHVPMVWTGSAWEIY